MRIVTILYLAIGLALLGAVLWEIDLGEVAAMVARVGWGMAVVLGLYLACFLIDSFTWLLALITVPLSVTWLYRAWKTRMAGEAFNNVVPAGGMGGEPVKAVLLKRHYGIGYRQGTASLVLAKTINMIALVIFLGGGFAMMLGSPALPASFKVVAGLGLAAFVLATVLFFAVQRLRISSIAGTWISRRRFARRVEGALHLIRDMDDRLVAFYTLHRRRFALAVALGLANWFIGALEIYCTTLFLGHPVSLAEAWIIEAVAQLVRAGTFFIPASIGAQEGAFLLVFSAMTGLPALGIAVAVVRRIREVTWIVWGFALASLFSLKPANRAGRINKP